MPQTALTGLHEIKFDGYRMHARLDAGRAQILTRRGNDWTDKYSAIARSIAGLPAQNTYLDGELCGVLPDGRTAFNLIQNATDTGDGSLCRRVGTGLPEAELERLWQRLQPLIVDRMPLAESPPRGAPQPGIWRSKGLKKQYELGPLIKLLEQRRDQEGTDWAQIWQCNQRSVSIAETFFTAIGSSASAGIMSPMLAAHSVCLFTTWGHLIRRQTMDEIEWAEETCNPLCDCTRRFRRLRRF